MHHIAVIMPASIRKRVLGSKECERLEQLAHVTYWEGEDCSTGDVAGLLHDTEAVITCWGSPTFDDELLTAAPRLSLIAHAAGSVKSICSQLVWSRGIQVTSAAAANAISVAEHTVGMMIALLKRTYWLNGRLHAGADWHEEYWRSKAMYRITVGIVGAGHIGRHVIRLLQSFEVDILLYDPYISSEASAALGAVKAESLDMLMAASDVVTLHAPEMPATRQMIHAGNLCLMKDNSLLINTSRGALIDEESLILETRSGRITAYLDVTQTEPLPPDSKLRGQSHIILSPHHAGALFNDMYRMGSLAVTEVERYLTGLPPLYSVRVEDLDITA
jgi:phosphoglycerate dehydrogenase-like enzyme